MSRPIVAVVGRPNVGKSTFFNKMAGARVSIVEDTPGVTRDRVYADCEWQNYKFTLIDTGGIDPQSDDPLLVQMRRQAQIAIDTADVIVFFTDGKDGMTAADEQVAELLRKTGKPVVLAVNKIDVYTREDNALEFYSLGFGTPMPISSVNLLGFGDLLEEICKFLPKPEEEEEQQDGPTRIAVIGRPNVGKSSLVNALLKEERVMVSDIPGTTRDAIDTTFEDGGDRFTLIDTAGIRRKSKIEDATLERYSVIRSLAAIRRCHVALVLIDATQGISEQEARIAGYVKDEGKACILIVNKWDAVEKDTYTMDAFSRMLRENLKFLDYAPILFLSAKTGQRVNRVLDTVRTVCQNAQRRITTGVLNDALHDAVTVAPPPADRGRRLKLFYATQTAVNPPTFSIFVNDQTLVHFSYERYLLNHMRKTFDFTGTPIRLEYRESHKGTQEGAVKEEKEKQ